RGLGHLPRLDERPLGLRGPLLAGLGRAADPLLEIRDVDLALIERGLGGPRRAHEDELHLAIVPLGLRERLLVLLDVEAPLLELLEVIGRASCSDRLYILVVLKSMSIQCFIII